MPKPCSLPVSSAYRWTILRARPSPTPSIHNTEPITMDDVIIIGGSFAGLAGALQLGRARRKVTVLDTGPTAPERTLVAVRAMVPVAQMPPNSGEAMLATPWATSSQFDRCRLPLIA